MTRIPLTPQGKEAMQAELRRLETVELVKIIDQIAEARKLGDLKENAEYHSAREKQGLVKARIDWLRAQLSNVQVIDVCQLKNDGRVIFGSSVYLVQLETGDRVTYQIVGEYEADINQGKLSVFSPLAKALVGRYAGDEIVVETQKGAVKYEIDKVDYV